MTNLVLVCGSYSNGAVWRPVIDHLPKDWTIATVTLPGYDGTPDPRSREDADVAHLAAPVIAAAETMPGPVHLAGHSFGMQAAVAAILSGKVDSASLTSFEGNLMSPLFRTGRSALAAEVAGMRDRFVAACDRGETDAAAMIIDYWGNGPVWETLPPSVQAFCRAGAGANALDWIGAVDYRPDLGLIAARGIPVTILRGALANPAMIAICDGLAEILPAARLSVLPAANHFLITTHPAECAAALESTVARAA